MIIHLANIMTINYLPETVQYIGNSKANMTWNLFYRTSLFRETDTLKIYNQHNLWLYSGCKSRDGVNRFTGVVWYSLSFNQHSSSYKDIRVLVSSLIKWTWGYHGISDLPLCPANYLHISDLIVWRRQGKCSSVSLKNGGQQEQNGEMWRNAIANHV